MLEIVQKPRITRENAMLTTDVASTTRVTGNPAETFFTDHVSNFVSKLRALEDALEVERDEMKRFVEPWETTMT